jgi:hypothetical protein
MDTFHEDSFLHTSGAYIAAHLLHHKKCSKQAVEGHETHILDAVLYVLFTSG